MNTIIEEYGESVIGVIAAAAVMALTGSCIYVYRLAIGALLEGIMFR